MLELVGLVGLVGLLGLVELVGLFGLLGLSVLLGLLLRGPERGDVDPKDVWRVGADRPVATGWRAHACPRAECEAAWPDMIRDTASRQPVRVSSVRALRLRQTWPRDAPLDLDPERVMTIGVCA